MIPIEFVPAGRTPRVDVRSERRDGVRRLLVSADDRFLVEACWAKAVPERSLVSVEDGQKAIDHLARAEEADPPALVLLDLEMPVRDGFEVLAWLRERPAFRNLRVIVMTASEIPGDVARAHDLGACSYVVKPSSVEELADLLRAVKDYWLRFNVSPNR